MQLAIVDSKLVAPTPQALGLCPCCRDEVVAKCGQINIWHWAHRTRDCDPWFEPESEWHRGWKVFVPFEQREVVMGPHRADMVATDGTVIELQHSSISPEEIAEREKFYGNMVWLFDAREWHITTRHKTEPRFVVGRKTTTDAYVADAEWSKRADMVAERLVQMGYPEEASEFARYDAMYVGPYGHPTPGSMPCRYCTYYRPCGGDSTPCEYRYYKSISSRSDKIARDWHRIYRELFGDYIYDSVTFLDQQGIVTFSWKWPRKSLSISRAPKFFDLGAAGILEVEQLYFSNRVGGWGHLLTHEEFVRRIQTK